MPETEATGKVRRIDTISDVELFRELVSFFGAQRVIELIGWAVVGGLVSGFTGDSPADLRKRMEERGFTRSSFYRALRDLRSFGEHLDGPYPAREHRLTLQVARRLAKLEAL